MNELKLNQFCLIKENEFLERFETVDPEIGKLLRQHISKASETNSQNYCDWLNWCKSQNGRIKVIQHSVPTDILPDKYNGLLYDIKVQGKKYAPDDQLYNNHDDLRYIIIKLTAVE